MSILNDSVMLKRQQGAALITSLVFMGILTMLGVSAMRSNTLDMKIHNAMKNRLAAFQCAESALRQGERYISDAVSEPNDTAITVPVQADNTVWSVTAPDIDSVLGRPDGWWATNGWSDWALNVAEPEVGCAKQAHYIVQSLGGVGGGESRDLSFDAQARKQMSGYKITSRSAGLSDDAEVILQSVYIRQFR